MCGFRCPTARCVYRVYRVYRIYRREVVLFDCLVERVCCNALQFTNVICSFAPDSILQSSSSVNNLGHTHTTGLQFLFHRFTGFTCPPFHASLRAKAHAAGSMMLGRAVLKMSPQWTTGHFSGAFEAAWTQRSGHAVASWCMDSIERSERFVLSCEISMFIWCHVILADV